MLNNVSLVGRPTKELELKIIGEGTPVCNFTLAVNRPYKNKDGENEADFIQCQAWKRQAEFLGTYVKKGHLIAITGAINTRTYEKDGVTKYVTEVNVNSVQSLEKKPQDDPLKPFTDKLTVDAIKALWTEEWNKRSVGLDNTAQANLKRELTKKYQPQIDSLETKANLPF